MLDKIDISKIEKAIKNNFSIIYEYKFNGLVLLYGGAIRDIIMNKKVHDFDFVILSQKKCEIEKFIKKYDLEYELNIFGGYKIKYNNIEIDMFTTDDLLDCADYDADLLFYDLDKKILIPCGPLYSYEDRTITEINKHDLALFSYKKRLNKLIEFIKYITNDDSKVKVKINRLDKEYRLLKRKIKYKIEHLKNIKNSNFVKCFRFLQNCKGKFRLIIILGLIISIISSVTPFLAGNLLVKILDKGFKSVIYIIITITILKLLTIFLSFIFSKIYLKIKKTMIFNIRREISEHIINLEVKNFNNNNSGSFINKIKDDPNEIATSFNKLKDFLVKSIGNFGMIIYIFYLSYQIGIVLIIFMIIIYKIKMKGIRNKIKAKKQILLEEEAYSSSLSEMITGIKDIKSLDLKKNYLDLTTNKFQSVSDIEYEGDYKENIYTKISSLIEFIAKGIILLIGILLVKKNILLSSSLVIIYMYNTKVFVILDRLTSFMDIRLNFNLSCSRIFSILDNNNYTKESYGNKKIKSCKGSIEFKSVYFKYDKNDVLKDCSFKVKENDMLAIIGKSGEGKTTILNLITKIYIPQKGKILIDNNDINELSEEYIRNNISIVSQNPYFFDMSIKDNLKLIKDNITDKELEDILDKVCLKDFILSLPYKYDTKIGEGGILLSQGQRQRLAIARALIKNTKIILLDEITSALDNENESNIKNLFDNIKKDHTIIIVTHDLKIVEDIKKIELKDGKINIVSY